MTLSFLSFRALTGKVTVRWVACLAILSLTAACGVGTEDEVHIELEPVFAYGLDDVLRMNHIQMVGTHNSYHIAPDPDEDPDMDEVLDAWDYTHAPLAEQLGEQGVRQFELDIFHDRSEQRFAVLHVPVVDEGTTCPWLTECLEEMLGWSNANPGHHPLFIFIEPKDMRERGAESPSRSDELDQAILSVWPRSLMVTPDDVQGEFPTLAEAVTSTGWPTLGEVRGKAVFVMLDTARDPGDPQYEYTYGLQHLEERVMFVTAEPGDSYAAVMKMDNPIHQFEQIQQAVRDGFMIRTRSDSPPFDYETDYPRSVSALASSAHMISTDYPVEGMMEGYFLDLTGGTPSRCNALVAPAECTSEQIESPAWLEPIGFR